MRIRSLLAILTAPLLFVAPGIASGQEPPQSPPPAQVVAPAPALTSIAGNWRFNPVATDNEQAKVRQGAARGGAIGGRGGRGGRLGAGGRGGIGGAGRMPGNAPDVNQARARLQAPEMLSIKRNEADAVIDAGRRRAQVLVTDGKEHPVPGGSADQQATVKAHWKGDKLEVERKMARGNGTRETYELSGDRRQLIVTVTVSAARNIVTLKRVYDPQPR